MDKISIRAIIRNAIIHNEVRTYQFQEIQIALGCSRHKAKQLYYAFLYNAEEKFLRKKLSETDDDSVKHHSV